MKNILRAFACLAVITGVMTIYSDGKNPHFLGKFAGWRYFCSEREYPKNSPLPAAEKGKIFKARSAKSASNRCLLVETLYKVQEDDTIIPK